MTDVVWFVPARTDRHLPAVKQKGVGGILRVNLQGAKEGLPVISGGRLRTEQEYRSAIQTNSGTFANVFCLQVRLYPLDNLVCGAGSRLGHLVCSLTHGL